MVTYHTTLYCNFIYRTSSPNIVKTFISDPLFNKCNYGITIDNIICTLNLQKVLQIVPNVLTKESKDHQVFVKMQGLAETKFGSAILVKNVFSSSHLDIPPVRGIRLEPCSSGHFMPLIVKIKYIALKLLYLLRTVETRIKPL
jgi:hypothetical protein